MLQILDSTVVLLCHQFYQEFLSVFYYVCMMSF